jgi:hypothetical protein
MEIVECTFHLFNAKAKFSRDLFSDLTSSGSILYKSHTTCLLRQQYQGVSGPPKRVVGA